MSKDNLKITISFGGRVVETDSESMDALAKAMKTKKTKEGIIKEALRIKSKRKRRNAK